MNSLLLLAIIPFLELAEAKSHRAEAELAPPYTYYLSTGYADEADRQDIETAMAFILPSLSLDPVVDHQIPQQATETLYAIDLRAYGWEHRFAKSIKGQHPYGPHDLPLVIRADWFLATATDCTRSTLYYDLLFGERFAKLDDFYKVLEVDDNPDHSFGMAEGKSRVVVSGKRWLASYSVPRGFAWETRDSERVNSLTDPLANPFGPLQHDARETIVGVPAIHMQSGVRGLKYVYMLSSGEGVTQDEAPPDIAQDYTRLLHGGTRLVNGVSCIGCHDEGMQMPTQNELRDYISDGGNLLTYDYDDQRRIEQFHLADIRTELTRNSEDYQAFVESATGIECVEAVAAFRRVIQRYHEPLTAKRFAAELGSDVVELEKAVAYWSAAGYPSPARVVAVASGMDIPRDAAEEHYRYCIDALVAWRGTQ